ncbi:hypothetical protein BDP27DRAFT_1378742 [Rhodocollybia butyracea]|uniref:Uncharacterized protein n=1 Tax=Rhodocollybia butyracea TaxID=206335 RepID=A0A9P5NZP5_9AGAR|nr:hypothetical protein BDP27DRAFT_1378742 [Rhodocollybia butyracea]
MSPSSPTPYPNSAKPYPAPKPAPPPTVASLIQLANDLHTQKTLDTQRLNCDLRTLEALEACEQARERSLSVSLSFGVGGTTPTVREEPSKYSRHAFTAETECWVAFEALDLLDVLHTRLVEDLQQCTDLEKQAVGSSKCGVGPQYRKGRQGKYVVEQPVSNEKRTPAGTCTYNILSILGKGEVPRSDRIKQVSPLGSLEHSRSKHMLWRFAASATGTANLLGSRARQGVESAL